MPVTSLPTDPCGSRRPRHLRAVRFHRIVGSLRSLRRTSNRPSPGRADGQEKSVPAHPAQAFYASCAVKGDCFGDLLNVGISQQPKGKRFS